MTSWCENPSPCSVALAVPDTEGIIEEVRDGLSSQGRGTLEINNGAFIEVSPNTVTTPPVGGYTFPQVLSSNPEYSWLAIEKDSGKDVDLDIYGALLIKAGNLPPDAFPSPVPVPLPFVPSTIKTDTGTGETYNTIVWGLLDVPLVDFDNTLPTPAANQTIKVQAIYSGQQSSTNDASVTDIEPLVQPVDVFIVLTTAKTLSFFWFNTVATDTSRDLAAFPNFSPYRGFATSSADGQLTLPNNLNFKYLAV